VSSAPSLYRRHRPRSFADLVGQEPVVRTLRHAVERGKVHHAYLFVGSRGTGKTSMAKILAACLNCEHGPTTEPCGVCESCRSIASASSVDVIEMDAASHNSVDDIRDLRDSVAYAPVSGRHKVYILDEAHMLSSAAWNAFLKTLEEPPPNTIFVLATTEAQKVPATVVDRCHRFDFQRPAVEQIAGVVRRAAQAEAIDIPAPAVAAIARSATGSFRDALGTLEQLVTYSGQTIALEDVLAVLGVADSELLREAFDAVAAGDARRALLTIHRCVESGRDASAFASDLETHARELLVVETLGSVPAELAVTPEADAALLEQAGRMPRGSVVRVLELLAAALEAVRAGAEPRTQLELALVKAATPAVDGSTRALLARIERLESALGRAGGDGIPTDPPASRAPGLTSTPSRRAAPVAQAAEPPRAEVSATRAVAGSAICEAATLVDAPAAASVGSAQAAASVAVAAAPVPESISADAMPSPSPDAGAPSESPPLAAVGVNASLGGDLESLQSLWPAVLDAVRAENALLGALIADAWPALLSGDELTVAFAPTAAFLKKRAEDPAHCAVVSEALRQITGRHLRLLYELSEDAGPAGGADVAPAPTEAEWVARFMAEFDAEELPVPQEEGE
jgi:DNA polymerase-3 subunit gamma/tau